MTAAADQTRIEVIDLARFYAIALVFYGLLIEEFMLLNNAAGAVSINLSAAFTWCFWGS